MIILASDFLQEFLADYKLKSELGFMISFGMTSGREVMGEMDTENIQGDVMVYFATALEKWAQKYPEKSREIAKEIVGTVQEFKSYSNGL